MARISDRHESDLGGKLKPFAEIAVTNVTVLVSSMSAHLTSTQHTAWMLINLLARLEGIVGDIGFVCPSGIRTAAKIVPLAPAEQDFKQAVLQGASAIGIIPVVDRPVGGFIFEVGAYSGWVGTSELSTSQHLHVYGEGWWGGVSQAAISAVGYSALPFGPYTAACLAVSEVFKAARMHTGSFEPITSAFYSTWLHQASTAPPLGGPDFVDDVVLDAALAGVGAVGSTWVHALWTCPDVSGRVLLADNDEVGIDRTNLNRYPLFGIGSVRRPKAAEAADICGKGAIEWVPHNGPFEDLVQIPPRVISAVDTNRSRAAIQQRYPARILSASTLDLRAEVLRCGPPGVGACLRCYNLPEPIPIDEEIREQLRKSSDAERARLAEEALVSKEELDHWVRTGRCGQASGRLLPFLRQSNNDTTHNFAVSFVSAMAGTLLAAEVIKDCIGGDAPLTDDMSRAVLQFWTPTAPSNRANEYRRDDNCPMCNPGIAATPIWRQRFYALQPPRQLSTPFKTWPVNCSRSGL